MKQGITDYYQDEQQDWVAVLACGHTQQVRHKPPFTDRPWVTTKAGRDGMLGFLLNCKKCDQGLVKAMTNDTGTQH